MQDEGDLRGGEEGGGGEVGGEEDGGDGVLEGAGPEVVVSARGYQVLVFPA